ncbi:hypothetical protein PO124_29895 [Bacillus licheniformis]|nr:hypothetical protein [Bacillus licheniformis]
MKFSKSVPYCSLWRVCFAFSSATAAGAGVWDNIGTYGMTSQTPIIKSSGGKFISQQQLYGFTFTLYEVDGAGSTPEIARKISTSDRKQQSGDRCQQFTDGANKQAELVLFKGNDTYITVTCYD